jgi:hypothetical protein
MKKVILFLALLFELSLLAGQKHSTVTVPPAPTPPPSAVPMIAKKANLIVRINPKLQAYLRQKGDVDHLFPMPKLSAAPGQLNALATTQDVAAIIAAANSAAGAAKDMGGIIQSFVGWCADCVNHAQSSHSSEEHRAREINDLCKHIPRDLDETNQTPEFIAGRLEQYWLQEGGKKKWTKQAKYFVKKRKEPVKGFVEFLLTQTAHGYDFQNIEYVLPYFFNEIDTYLASPAYRKSADPRKDDKT